MHRAAALARASAALRGGVGRQPDAAALIFILTVALGLRLAFTFRAPVFLVHDSIAYFQTGHDFARGLGFELPYKRAPLYPLFIAGVVTLAGPDPQAVAFFQHLLAVLSAALTYYLGRALAGRAAGLIAGLLVALAGPLIIAEHYLLAEALFIPLLLSFALTFLRGIRAIGSGPVRFRSSPTAPPPAPGYRWLILAGLLLGLAGLVRSVGFAVLLILPPVLLLALRAWRQSLLGGLAVGLGFSLISLPWMTRNYLEYGAFEIVGGTGQHLTDRVSRHDEGFVIPRPDSPSPYADPVRTEARALVLRQMAREARPSAINHRLREVYGWSEVEADRLMREVALEIIVGQPERFARGTLAKLRRLLRGEEQSLYGYHWATRRAEEPRRTWDGNQSIAGLVPPPTPAQEAEKATADRIVTLFSPAALRDPLGLLLLAGIVAGLLTRRWASTLFLVLLVLVLTVPSAAMVGYVPRYRYPADPFLAALIGAGFVWLTTAPWRLGRAVATRRRQTVTEQRSRAGALARGT